MAGADFDGDGRDDVLWLDTRSGGIINWRGQSNGSLVMNDVAGFDTNSIGHLVAIGDFNGDGRDDTLWRSNNELYLSFTFPGGAPYFSWSLGYVGSIPTEWKVAGTGDFNGDGHADILLRRDDGWLTNWLGTDSYAFTNNGVHTSLFFDPDWKVVGTGDFNGDGLNDLLLRRDDGWVTNWLGTGNGGFVNNGASTSLFFSADWKIAGTGDINGDGKDDMILRSDAGWITDWLGTSTGGFTNNGANASLFLTTDWHVASIGDFNGDGKDDLALRRDDGWLTDWLGTQSGSFTDNGANFSTFVAPNWLILDHAATDPWPGYGDWDY